MSASLTCSASMAWWRSCAAIAFCSVTSRMITWNAGAPSHVVRTETDSTSVVPPSNRTSTASAGSLAAPGSVSFAIRRSISGRESGWTKSVIGRPRSSASDAARTNRTAAGFAYTSRPAWCTTIASGERSTSSR